MVAALIMWKTHSPARFYADPALSILISLIIFASAISLSEFYGPFSLYTGTHAVAALKSGRILLEASPIHLNLDRITEDLLAVCINFSRSIFTPITQCAVTRYRFHT